MTHPQDILAELGPHDTDNRVCGVCRGPLVALGCWGGKVHARCRDCGAGAVLDDTSNKVVGGDACPE